MSDLWRHTNTLPTVTFPLWPCISEPFSIDLRGFVAPSSLDGRLERWHRSEVRPAVTAQLSSWPSHDCAALRDKSGPRGAGKNTSRGKLTVSMVVVAQFPKPQTIGRRRIKSDRDRPLGSLLGSSASRPVRWYFPQEHVEGSSTSTKRWGDEHDNLPRCSLHFSSVVRAQSGEPVGAAGFIFCV